MALTESQIGALVESGQMKPATAVAYMNDNYGSSPGWLRGMVPEDTPLQETKVEYPPAEQPKFGEHQTPASLNVHDIAAGMPVPTIPAVQQPSAPATGVPQVPGLAPMPKPTADDVAAAQQRADALRGSLATPGGPIPAPTLPSNNSGAGGGGSLPPSKAAKEMRQQIQFEQDEAQAQARDQAAILARKTDAELAKNKAMADMAEANNRDAELRFRQDEDRRTKAMDSARSEMDEATRRGQEAANRQVDPKRFWGSLGTAGQIVATLGLMFGEFGATLTHTPNGAAQLIDAAISRDIDAQKENIANGMAGARMGIDAAKSKYGMAFDDATFSAKARVEQLAFARAKLDAMSQKLDDPIMRANAQQLGAELQQRQAKATADLARQKIALDEAEEARAAAAAAAGARRGADLQKEYYKLVQENMGRGDDLRTAQARALSTLNMGNYGNISAYPKKEGKMTDQEEAMMTSNEFNKQVDDLVKDPALKELGLVAGVGGAVSGIPYVGPRVASDSAALKTKIDTFNTQLLQAVGKVAKDADGKPNKDMIEKIEHRFSIDLTDTEDQARAKVEGARRVVNALARQQGALNAPVPGAARDQNLKDLAGFQGEK